MGGQASRNSLNNLNNSKNNLANSINFVDSEYRFIYQVSYPWPNPKLITMMPIS